MVCKYLGKRRFFLQMTTEYNILTVPVIINVRFLKLPVITTLVIGSIIEKLIVKWTFLKVL